jgi:hypothetical protein
MTSKLAAVLFGFSTVAATLPLLGAEAPEERGPKRSFELLKTERAPFLPGGTIHVDNSYGYLTVEGWDEPEVEITVTKSTDRFFEPGQKEKAVKHFDQIRVVTERRSDKELAISTATPFRTSLFTSVLPSGQMIITTPLPPNNKRGVTVEYAVRVPRDSRLVVHQDNGYVWVSGVTGDLEVHSHTGDMIVMLPDPGPYAIDARTRVGRIASDIPCKTGNPLLAGGRLLCQAPVSAPRVRLRMGRGSIAIKTGPLLRR